MALRAGTIRGVSIHPETALGTVRLTVADLARSRAFYEQALGLLAWELGDGTMALGVDHEHPLIELRGERSAPALNPRATGLFHLAILVPTRRDLALALMRLTRTRWPLDGASDHLVSEALYLSDPDGNGIEIYRDRPASSGRGPGGGSRWRPCRSTSTTCGVSSQKPRVLSLSLPLARASDTFTYRFPT